MSAEQPFFALDDDWCDHDSSGVHILPAPYEGSTSYGKGTSNGPAAVRNASAYLELYDEELDTEIFRLSGGIATQPSLRFDGDLKDEKAVSLIYEAVLPRVKQGRTVVTIGGEHTISIGAARAYAEHFQDLSVLQLDAHSDLRQSYEGNPFSHASAMARIYEHNRDIVQVGIRSQCIEESELIKKEGIKTFYSLHIRNGRYGHGDSWHEEVIASLGKNVYLTIDCDFFDPSVIPAVGTPEPGGFGWDETMRFLRKLAERRNITGFDVNELQPIPSLSYADFTVAKLIYKLIGYIYINKD
ncbi:MAG: agmatinase [Nitrospirota bacterium]|nr:MAG: agmatinase [Nitrospirota bacterium]